MSRNPGAIASNRLRLSSGVNAITPVAPPSARTCATLSRRKQS